MSDRKLATMRQLGALSDVEFESLVGGLLRASTGRIYERFGVGADGGIDLRQVDPSEERNEIVQCKHYVRSSFSQLLAAARLEVPKLEAIEPTPTLYRFITSQSLTKGQKTKLMDALDPWIKDPGLIWGAESIEDELDAHPDVERSHVKLWLSSSTQLERLLNAGTLNRSADLIERINRALPRYVQTNRFFDAQEMLDEMGVCLIAGEPGIGKTTLAQMLLLDCANQGFDALYVSENVSEAWDALTDTSQAFYYDDFLGRIGLQGLTKNEDQRLVDLIARAQRDPRKTRVILTTREYILRGALRLYENFERAELEHDRFLLALSDYTRLERGMVLYNHLYHSQAMRPEWLAQLVDQKAYLQIIDHPNYNPRLIEFITGHAKPHELEHINDDWVAFALAALDHPEEIWKRAYEHELDLLQQTMLALLVTIGGEVDTDRLRVMVEIQCEAEGVQFTDGRFDDALQVLELTFVRFGAEGEAPTIDVINPSIGDFLMNHLLERPERLRSLLRQSTNFAQPRQLWQVSAAEDGVGRAMKGFLGREVELLADAFIRTFTSDELKKIGKLIYSPGMENRLSLMIGACGSVLADGDRLAWLTRQLEGLGAEWVAGAWADERAVALHQALMEGPIDGLTDITGPPLKVAIERRLHTASGFECLDELWRADPGLFGNEGRIKMTNDFTEFASIALEEEPSSEDLHRIERVADSLGVELDEADLEWARERAREEEDNWEPDIDRIGAIRDDEELDGEAEDAEIDDLFERLKSEPLADQAAPPETP